ncbi:MAG: pyridoxal phosphate-dependent aminotransferase [Cocleimonas sp.]|nr:pyridoxal phosphate-dependent aminotransferase [Cocleimonas sp.]
MKREIVKKDQLFSNEQVPHALLQQRAFNYRWAEIEQDIIPLTAADPDFKAPVEIGQAISDYALEGLFSYGPHQGMDSFKNALVDTFLIRKNYHLQAEHILPIDSVASAMYIVARNFLEEGDEAIIFDPVDFLFEQAVLATGATVIRCAYDTKKASFSLDQLEQLINKKTKLIGICNPHNPLGKLLEEKELTAIAQLANQHSLVILNDEIWSDIVYPEKKMVSFHHLAPELQQNVITVYGFSKAFGLAGLRIGAIIAPNQDTYDSLVDTSHVMTTAGGVSTLSQIAATTALLRCWYWVDEFLLHLTKMRDYAVKRLNKMPGLSCATPEATYLLFINIKATGYSAEALVAELYKNKVAVVPGNEKFFGPGAKNHIRICFATSEAILTEGLDSIEKTLMRLGIKHAGM